MTIDTFCKGLQDSLRDEIDMFLASLVALAPSANLAHLYTYSAFGMKDLLPESRPFRMVTVAVTNGLYVDRTSVIKAVLTIVFDSTTNDERPSGNVVIPTEDQFGAAHNECYAAFHEWLVTNDFTQLLDAEILSGDVEEANLSLVDTLAIDVYFNPAIP